MATNWSHGREGWQGPGQVPPERPQEPYTPQQVERLELELKASRLPEELALIGGLQPANAAKKLGWQSRLDRRVSIG